MILKQAEHYLDERKRTVLAGNSLKVVTETFCRFLNTILQEESRNLKNTSAVLKATGP